MDKISRLKKFLRPPCLKFFLKVSFSTQPEVFDRALKLRHRNQSLIIPDSTYYDYLREEVANRLVDRLDDITRKFPDALELGSHRGHFLKTLLSEEEDRSEIPGGIKNFTQTDSSKNAYSEAKILGTQQDKISVNTCISDDEILDIKPNSLDLIVSSLTLHWVNDLPSTLKQICDSLRPDGCFLGAMLGGHTLKEFRYCMYLAEQERKGGYSPHTSPFASASDISSLLQRAGFQLQTVDVDSVQIGYPDLFSLLEHLQKMGEGNASLNRQLGVGKDTFLAAAAMYKELYGLEDGSVPATFQVIYMIGWKHDESQPKAKQRGSASKSLKELSR